MNNFNQLGDKIFNNMWMMKPSLLKTYASNYNKLIKGEMSICGEGETLQSIVELMMAEMNKGSFIDGKLQVVPVWGSLMKNPSLLEQVFFGATGYDDIETNINAALANKDVEAIMLDFRSGGGSVLGCEECSAFIQYANTIKPVYAFNGEMMLSAAYALGVNAETIFVTPSSMNAMVGVWSVHVDATQQYKDAGLVLDVFSAGEDKLIDADFTTLTKEQKDYLQSTIDRDYQHFVNHVVEQRAMPKVNADMVIKEWRARIYDGIQSVELGSGDRLVRSQKDTRQIINEHLTA